MAFTIAHDYENDKVAHMTSAGIVYIEYIGSIFDQTKVALSARDNTLHDVFNGRLVKDPFNPAKVHEEKPICFEDHLQSREVLRKHEVCFA